jgi:hypothetical protein
MYATALFFWYVAWSFLYVASPRFVRGVENSLRGVDFVIDHMPRSDAVHAVHTTFSHPMQHVLTA